MTEAAAEMPLAASEEVLKRYADILRVGRIRVNGELVRWDTSTSTREQLRAFCTSLHKKLSALLPDLVDRHPAALRYAAYFVCKSVSINYALVEVILLVKKRVGVLCAIETTEDGGGMLVEYGVEVLPELRRLRPSLTWSRGGNIVYRDPRNAEKRVKGTLTGIFAEFPLVPEPGQCLEYTLEMQLAKSLTAKVVSTLVCRGRGILSEKIDEPTMVLIHEPLRPDASGVFEELSRDVKSPQGRSSASPRPPSLHGGVDIFGLPPLDFDELADMDTMTLLNSDRPRESPTLENPELLVGHLRARIVRVRNLSDVGQALVPSSPSSRFKLYVTCGFAGRTEWANAASSCPNTDWGEEWTFRVLAKDLRSEVAVEVYGVDAMGGGQLQLLGRASVPITNALRDMGSVAHTENLSGVQQHGVVDLELELLPELGPTVFSHRGEDGFRLRSRINSRDTLATSPGGAGRPGRMRTYSNQSMIVLCGCGAPGFLLRGIAAWLA